MADLTSQQKLDEARAALHRLRTGQAEEDVTYRDRRVRFTPANMAALAEYVTELEAEISPVDDTTKVREPIRFVF